MRIVKNFLTVVLFSSFSLLATAGDIVSERKPLGAQIQTLLKGIEYDKFVNAETKMNISFFVNAQNEIIVVSTNNTALDGVIKSALNYKKLDMHAMEYNTVYTIPVVIK